MKKYYILLLFICTSCSVALEEFTYYTKFRKLRVGNTKIDIFKEEKNDKKTILTVNSSTNKFIDLIYKLRHFSTIIVNDENFSLLATTQKLQQGSYIDSYNATVDYKLKKIYYQNTKDIKHDKQQNHLILTIDGLVYDPLSIVYYLRQFDINVGEKYTFTSYNKKKIRDIDLYVETIEKIRTPYLSTECFVVVPRAKGQGPLLKHEGEMKIWFTVDTNHLPIKIQQKMRHGIMELTLKNYVEK